MVDEKWVETLSSVVPSSGLLRLSPSLSTTQEPQRFQSRLDGAVKDEYTWLFKGKDEQT